jgi:hypothetical protein
MGKQTVRLIFIIIALTILMVSGCVVAFFIGRANYRSNGATGQQLTTAESVNSELGEEQQRAAEFNQSAIRQLEEIRRITEETDSSLSKLRELNNGSSNISAQIREEATLLAHYFRSVSSMLDGNSGSVRAK